MTQVPAFISKDEEIDYWKKRAYDTEAALNDLQESSYQYEQELEATVSQIERENKDLKNVYTSLKNDLELFKDKAEKRTKELTTKLEELENERNQFQKKEEKYVSYIRELEQKNDDYERAQRALHMSLLELETKINATIERNALLESEQDEKQELESVVQRLKDEIRDLKQDQTRNHREREQTVEKETLKTCSRKSSLESIDSSNSITPMTPFRIGESPQIRFDHRQKGQTNTDSEISSSKWAERILRKITEMELKLQASIPLESKTL